MMIVEFKKKEKVDAHIFDNPLLSPAPDRRL
jgi:hypothetical protein